MVAIHEVRTRTTSAKTPFTSYIDQLPSMNDKIAFMGRVMDHAQGNFTHGMDPNEATLVAECAGQIRGSTQDIPNRKKFQEFILEMLFHVEPQHRMYFSDVIDHMSFYSPERLVSMIVQVEISGGADELRHFGSFDGSGAWELYENRPIYQYINDKDPIFITDKNDVRCLMPKKPSITQNNSNIYFAWDTHLQKEVVVKKGKRNSLSIIPDTIEREAKIARITHPNLPIVYDYIEQNGDQYIVMEHIKGVTLSDRIADKKHPLTAQEIMFVANEMARLIDDLATMNPPLFHRDLKPDNIIISPYRVCATDLGISNWVNSDGIPLGSLEYASPEQFDPDTQPSLVSEIFNLAATLYTSIAGKPPFLVSELDDSRDANYIPLDSEHLIFSLDGSKINSLNAIFKVALHANPSERYKTGRELASALSSVFDSQE